MKGELTDVAPKNVLDLLLLETALDDEAPGAVNTSVSTQLGEQVLNNVLGLRESA